MSLFKGRKLEIIYIIGKKGLDTQRQLDSAHRNRSILSHVCVQINFRQSAINSEAPARLLFRARRNDNTHSGGRERVKKIS